MLFDDEQSVYDDGLFLGEEENFTPPLQTQENKGQMNQHQTRLAALGMTRTNDGFVMNSPPQSMANDFGTNESYTSYHDGDITSYGEWEPISSNDIYNLRVLGLEI